LVRLGWAHGDQEVFTRDELVDYFTLDAVGKKGAIFDPEKLKWMNSVYMREQSAEQLFVHIKRDVLPGIDQELTGWDTHTIEAALQLYLDRVHTLKELGQSIIALHHGPEKYDADSLQKWVNAETITYLEQIIVLLESNRDWSKELITEELKLFAKKTGHKLVTLMQPMRIALIGSDSGPGVFDLLSLLGKDESIKRMRLLQAR
jgi:glutamyl-tRNA synthetase